MSELIPIANGFVSTKTRSLPPITVPRNNQTPYAIGVRSSDGLYTGVESISSTDKGWAYSNVCRANRMEYFPYYYVLTYPKWESAWYDGESHYPTLTETQESVIGLGQIQASNTIKVDQEGDLEISRSRAHSRVALVHEESVLNMAVAVLDADIGMTVKSSLKLASFAATVLIGVKTKSPMYHIDPRGNVIGLRVAAQLRRLSRKDRQYMWAISQSLVTASIQEAASAYLLWNFGVRPTKADITRFLGRDYHALISVNRKIIPRYSRIRASFGRAPSMAGIPMSEPVYLGNDSGNAWLGNNGTFHNSSVTLWPDMMSVPWKYAEVRSVQGLFYGTLARDYVTDDSLLRTISLSMPPLATAWELTRLSFLVDYFINIGGALQAAELASYAAERRATFVEGIWESRSSQTSVYAPVPRYAARVYDISLAWQGEEVWWYKSEKTLSQSSWSLVQRETIYYRDECGIAPIPIPNLRVNLHGYQKTTVAAMLIANSRTLKRVRGHFF